MIIFIIHITLGSLESCVTILGREVFSTVSSHYEYEESEKNHAKGQKVSKTRTLLK